MKKILNSNTIKIIAIVAMTIDHIAWLVFPGYNDVINYIAKPSLYRPYTSYCHGTSSFSEVNSLTILFSVSSTEERTEEISF